MLTLEIIFPWKIWLLIFGKWSEKWSPIMIVIADHRILKKWSWSDHGSWFSKMIVSDRGSQKIWSFLALLVIYKINFCSMTIFFPNQTLVYVVKYRIYQVVGDTLDNGLGWCMLASFSASHLSTYSSFLLSSQSFEMFKNVQKFSKNCNKYT